MVIIGGELDAGLRVPILYKLIHLGHHILAFLLSSKVLYNPTSIFPKLLKIDCNIQLLQNLFGLFNFRLFLLSVLFDFGVFDNSLALR